MVTSVKFNYMKYITLTLLIAVFLYGVHSATAQNAITASSFYSNELPIYCVNTDKPVVALTFDSAWGTEDLEQILSILKKHNAPATFFVTGEWAEKYPEAILSIDQAGHEIANHGNSTSICPSSPRKKWLRKSRAAITPCTISSERI